MDKKGFVDHHLGKMGKDTTIDKLVATWLFITTLTLYALNVTVEKLLYLLANMNCFFYEWKGINKPIKNEREKFGQVQFTVKFK